MTDLPLHACNAHCHVFGPPDRFPYAGGGAFVPEADAPKEMLYALNDSLGLSRCVVVQSACHGFDNSATEGALLGRPGAYAGIALLPFDVSDAELRRLDRAGFRGVRFNYMSHLGKGADIGDVLSLARRFTDLGWHLQIHGSPDAVLGEVVPRLLEGPVPVVIDHIARMDASLGPQQKHVEMLHRLLDNEACWVKVSGMDRISKAGPPYVDAQPIARGLVEAFPDRVLWGNDWPHPNHSGPIPDDAELVRLIDTIARTPQAKQALLADNPARLYRFGD